MTTTADDDLLLTYGVEPLTEGARSKLVRPENGPTDRSEYTGIWKVREKMPHTGVRTVPHNT